MGVNSLPTTVTRQRRDCDLNPGPSAPESSTLTTRLPSHPRVGSRVNGVCRVRVNIKIVSRVRFGLGSGSRLGLALRLVSP